MPTRDVSSRGPYTFTAGEGGGYKGCEEGCKRVRGGVIVSVCKCVRG